MSFIQPQSTQDSLMQTGQRVYVRHETAALQDGGYAIAAHRIGPGEQGVDVALYAADGSYRGTPVVLDWQDTTLRTANPTITATPDGGFILAYDFCNSIRVLQFDAAGQFSAPAIAIPGTGNAIRQKASVDVLENGNIALSYSIAPRGDFTYYNDTDVGYAIFTPQGQQVRPDTALQVFNDPNATDYRLVEPVGETTSHLTALSGGGFVVVNTVFRPAVLSDISFVELRIFDAVGNNVSGEELIAQSYRAAFVPVGRYIPEDKPTQSKPQVVELADGNILVAWFQGALYGRVFSRDGTKLTDQLTIANFFSDVNSADRPEIAALPDGGFVVTYVGELENTDTPAIGIIRYDADLVRVEERSLLPNSPPSIVLNDATVTVLADGDVVVTWEDALSDGDIGIQRFDVGVLGSDGNDVLTGNGDADQISAKAGDDLLNGMGGIDTLTGGQGDDTLMGGDDIDYAVFDGPKSGYTLTLSATSTTLTDRRAEGSGTDTLSGIEYLDFDGTIDTSFGLFQQTGIATLSGANLQSFIELYIAYFNRAPDAEGLGFWGAAFANGFSLQSIAGLFIDSDEYRATYPEGQSNADFATAVYNNVLGRVPDAEGFDFWVGALDSGGVARDQFILFVLGGAKVDPALGASQAFIDQQLADREYLATKTDIGAYFSVHKGMSDVADASAAMAFFDGTAAGATAAISAIDGFYADAVDADTGAFLIQVIGVLDDPFSVA